MDLVSLYTIFGTVGGVLTKLLDEQAVGKLVSTVAGEVMGGRVDAALCAVCGKGWEFFKNLRTTDPDLNHDVERACREAYLIATLELVRQAEIRAGMTAGRGALLYPESGPGLERIRLGIQRDLRDAGNTLPEALPDVQLFLLDAELAPAARRQRLHEALERNLAADLARWLNGLAEPPVIRELLSKGWLIDSEPHKGVAREWHGLIAIAFIEKLKSQPRLSAVFQSRILAQLAEREPAAEGIATFDGFAAEFDRLSVPLQRIEDSLGVIGRDVAEIKSGVAELKTMVTELLTAQRAGALAKERHVADERESLLLTQLEQRDREVRALASDLARSDAEREAARREAEELRAEWRALIDRLAERDRAFAAEVNEFRRQISGLAESKNPELLRELQRFADGDRRGSYPVIKRILEAENRAAETATRVRNAARLRELAALALVMKDRGEMNTAAVIAAWREAQDLDPSFHRGWVELRRLYMEGGNLVQARFCAEKAAESAGSERERSVAAIELGEVLVAAGELAEARRWFEASLALLEKLAKENPASAAAQRDVSVSLSKLGDVLVAAGELAEARRRFEASLALLEKLAKENPASAAAQRDVSVSLEKLGDVLVEAGELAEARRRFEDSLRIREELAKENPASAEAQRDVWVSYFRMGNLTAERNWWVKALAIVERLEAEGRLQPSDRRWLPILREQAGKP